MSTEQNLAAMRRFVDEAFNGRQLDVIDELYRPDAIDHNPLPGLPQGALGRKLTVAGYLAAFPDMRLTVEELVAEGDKVAVRWIAEATHQGELMGIPPTGKRIRVGGAIIERYVAGRVAERWEVFDQVGLLQQLGVMPAPAAA